MRPTRVSERRAEAVLADALVWEIPGISRCSIIFDLFAPWKMRLAGFCCGMQASGCQLHSRGMLVSWGWYVNSKRSTVKYDEELC